MSVEGFGPDYGRVLDASLIEAGLRALCPGLHFDMAGKLGQVHPFINDRQGVYYEGRHIVSMDRGFVPEYKIWDAKDYLVPIEWCDADKEGASIRYESVLTDDPQYVDIYAAALKGSDPNYFLRDDGSVIRCYPVAMQKRKNRVVRVGWRHTFERLIQANLPGLTREAISRKFGVDMSVHIFSTPEEVVDAFVSE